MTSSNSTSKLEALTALKSRRMDGLRMLRFTREQAEILKDPCSEIMLTGSNRGGKTLLSAARFAAIARDIPLMTMDGDLIDCRLPHQKDRALLMWVIGDYLKRKSSTAEQQKFEQAQRDWVRSKLRKESGAVIGEQEMKDEIRTYFPQPGDTPEVIAQKEQARQVAIQAMRDAAGPALGKTPAAQPKKDGNLSTDEQRELMELRKRFKK